MGFLRVLLAALVLLGGGLAGGPAWAVSPYDDVLVERAMKNLAQENYEEAAVELTEAWEKGTKTPEKAFMLGEVYRRMLNYPKAREYLQEALRLKPKYPEAKRLLADTLVATDRLEEALPYLKELEQEGYQPSHTAMLMGLVAFKQKRYEDAVQYFRQAEADPALAQDAKFQIGLVQTAQNRLKEARKTLDEAFNLGPQTNTAGFAQRYADALERRIKEVRPLKFNAWMGIDFDSNVTLQPGDPTAAQQVSGKGDAVYTLVGNVEYNVLPYGPLALLAQYSYYQNFHPRLTNYDMLSHTMGPCLTYTTARSKFWLPFNYAYVDVASDKYYTAFNVSPTYLYLLSPKVGVETGVRFARKYYWFPLSLTEDDRSGKSYGTSLGLYYFLKNQQGYLLARFHYDHDSTTGSNWDNSSYRLFFMALYPVTDRLKVSGTLDLILQPYDHSWFGSWGGAVGYYNKRDDKILIAGININYVIYKGLELNAHYYFVRDDSNIPLYDYDRHIVGAQLGYRY